MGITTLDAARRYADRLGLTGRVYYFRCQICNTVLVSKRKDTPKCMVCMVWGVRLIHQEDRIVEGVV